MDNFFIALRIDPVGTAYAKHKATVNSGLDSCCKKAFFIRLCLVQGHGQAEP